MLKKLFDSFFILLKSGILLHRCTIIGVLCGVWVFFGAEAEESAFRRMLTLDLYLFMASFLMFYRLLFNRIDRRDGSPDWPAMGICLIGDFAWAVAAMFCTVPFFMLAGYSDGADYADKARAAVDPRVLIRKMPRPH